MSELVFNEATCSVTGVPSRNCNCGCQANRRQLSANFGESPNPLGQAAAVGRELSGQGFTEGGDEPSDKEADESSKHLSVSPMASARLPAPTEMARGRYSDDDEDCDPDDPDCDEDIENQGTYDTLYSGMTSPSTVPDKLLSGMTELDEPKTPTKNRESAMNDYQQQLTSPQYDQADTYPDLARQASRFAARASAKALPKDSYRQHEKGGAALTHAARALKRTGNGDLLAAARSHEKAADAHDAIADDMVFAGRPSQLHEAAANAHRQASRFCTDAGSEGQGQGVAVEPPKTIRNSANASSLTTA
jgi:hypothetical protein